MLLKSMLRATAAAVGVMALAATPALAQKKYDPGASDTEIKIGNIMPYSGPASAYALIAKTQAAYFKKVNDEGGINGRKINFISYDDGYSPPKAVEQARKLVESDEVLRKATRRNLGRDEYYISFLGQPSATEPWMIQFGGHHLAINITLAGAQGTLAPSHTGAQPAIYELEGKSVRPLGREVDKAFKLMSSLDPAQRKKAILGFQVRDLVLGQGQDGVTIQPEGIKGSELSEPQREMLLDLASEWVGIQEERVAQAKMDEIKGNISETWFAWSGSTEKGRAAYFRIQGPTVIIEYAPQGSGNPPMHIHTMYRDPTNDYGASWRR